MSTDLAPLFKRLHLANARRVWRDLVRRAEAEEWSYEQLLTTLISEEVAHRRGTRLNRAVRSAQLPFLRTISRPCVSRHSARCSPPISSARATR